MQVQDDAESGIVNIQGAIDVGSHLEFLHAMAIDVWYTEGYIYGMVILYLEKG